MLVSMTCLILVEVLIEEGRAEAAARHWPEGRRSAGRRPRAQSLSTPSVVARSASTASTLGAEPAQIDGHPLDLGLVRRDDKVEASLGATSGEFEADAGGGAGDDGELIGGHERILR